MMGNRESAREVSKPAGEAGEELGSRARRASGAKGMRVS